MIAALQRQSAYTTPTGVCSTGGCSRTLGACLWLSWWDQLLQLLVPWVLSRHCHSWTWVWMAGRYNTLVLPSVMTDYAIVIIVATVSIVTLKCVLDAVRF